MNIKKYIKRKKARLKYKIRRDKDQFEILEIIDHTKIDYSKNEYMHTVICKTDREVKDFGLLAHIISEKVGYDTNGYMYCGLKQIIFLEQNKYQISWNTWNNCDQTDK